MYSLWQGQINLLGGPGAKWAARAPFVPPSLWTVYIIPGTMSSSPTVNILVRFCMF